MSSTQDHLHGRFADALTSWGEQLAAGRSRSNIEAEIIARGEGRVDLRTDLLVEAETLRESAAGGARRASSPCAQRGPVPEARLHHGTRPTRALEAVAGTGDWY